MSYDDTIQEDSRWFKKPKGDVHQYVFKHVEDIHNDQHARREDLRSWRALYEDRGQALGKKSKKNRVTYNVVKSCTDTGMAKIAKNRPRPQFMTTEGEYDLQEKARGLTKFTDGAFMEMRAYEVGQLVFRDAMVLDGGALKVYVEDGRIKCARARTRDLYVDAIDGQYGKPRELHERRRVNRDVLCELFPKSRYEIKTCPAADRDDDADDRTAHSLSMIEVIETWHLPSGKKAKDGRHTICIENATLLDERYEKQRFPFIFFFWNEPMEGFWSAGLAEELRGIQAEINRLLDDIRLAQKRMGRPFVLVERSAEVNKAAVNNEIGTIIEYNVTPPTFGMTNAMPAEVYAHLERLYQRAYEITGISQMSARGQKPAGLDSGRALREFQDIESERFVLVGQRWEQFFMDLARLVVDLARDIEDYEVKARDERGLIERINFSEVDLDEDCYELQVFPVSILPTTPAGRYEMVVDLAQNALIKPEQAKQLLHFPDVEDELTLDMASRDGIRKIIDGMLAGGEYEGPEPFYNLSQAKELAVKCYLRARVKGAKEENLAKVRQFIAEVDTMLEAATMPDPAELQAQLAGGGGAMPPGGMPPSFPAPPAPKMPLEGVGGMPMV